jgi:O-antigen ligase
VTAGPAPALDAWRAIRAAETAARATSRDRWIAIWSGLLLTLTLAYALIGHAPYSHQLVEDAAAQAERVAPFNRYVWLAFFAMAAPVLALKADVLRRALPRLWPLFALYAWFALTTTWAIDKGAADRRLLLYFVSLGIALAVRIGLPDGRRTHLITALVCAGVTLIDLGSWIFAPKLSMTDIGLAAIHSHKNTLGAVMLFTLIVAGTWLTGPMSRAARAFWIGILAAAFALLVGSQSKTSLGIAVGVGVLAPLVVWTLTLPRRMLVAVIAAVLAALFAAALAWFGWCGLQGLDPFAPFEGLTFTQRTDVWRFALDEFAKRPIRGVGFGSFWDVDPAVQPSLKTDYWFAKPDAPTNEAHNGYLDLAVTTGLPGVIGAAFLLGRWIVGGLARVRVSLTRATERSALPFSLFLAVFALAFMAHNWLESSYFTAESAFGLIIVLVGVAIDLRPATGGREPRPDAADTGAG